MQRSARLNQYEQVKALFSEEVKVLTTTGITFPVPLKKYIFFSLKVLL